MSSKSCRAIVPPNTDACGKAARYLVTFTDGDRASMCADCMMYMREFAAAQGAPVRIEKVAA